MITRFLFLLCIISTGLKGQVTVEFKIKPGSGNTLNGSVEICNNSGSDLPAGYYMDFYWPNFNIVDLTSQPGTVVYPGDGLLRMQFNAAWMLPAAGACRSHSVNSTSTYDNPFLFPPYGIDSNGDTIEVVVTDPKWIPKSGQNEPQEFYIAQECFIPSPDQYCLGEARFEEWNRLADVRVPENRKGWALAAAHSHRLFTNMMGCEVTSLNFVMATSMIEGRMGCDANAQPPAGDAHPLTYESHITTDGCLQIRPLGYLQTQDFYPHLFANTPKASITDGDNFITSALTKTLYDYTSFTFWDQYYCYPEVREFFCNLNDPYGADAIFGYTYHKGWNNTDFQKVFIDNRDAWQNSDNIADMLSTSHSDIHGGYAERVRNNIMRLENNFNVDPSLNYGTAIDNWDSTTYEFYGCYNEPFTWQEVADYIDEALRVFITADANRVKTAAQNAFNAIAVGGQVNFQDIGPVIDAIVLNIPVPSANQGMTGKYFSQAETCIKPGIKIHSYDEICPGENAELLIYLMGQPPFSYTIQGPDGTLYSRSGVSISTDVLNVNQPGEYKIISMQDANGELDLKCNTARTEISNAGNASAAWNKSRYDAIDDCYEGELELVLTGNGPWEITYTKNGGSDVVINVPAGNNNFTIETPSEGDVYVLKGIVAGGCNSVLNDEINFCQTVQNPCVPPQAEIINSNPNVCQGDTAIIELNLLGSIPFSLNYRLNNVSYDVQNVSGTKYSIQVYDDVVFELDTLWDSQCVNDTLTDSTRINFFVTHEVDLGVDIQTCGEQFSIQVDSSFESYNWIAQARNGPFLLANQSGEYILEVIDSNGCSSSDTINVDLGSAPNIDIGDSIVICESSLPYSIDAQSLSANAYLWQDGSTDSVFEANAPGLYWVEAYSGTCSVRDSVFITLEDELNVDIGADQVICPQGTAEFSSSVQGAEYSWNNVISNQDAYNTSDEGEVILTVTDSNGCFGSDTAMVVIENNLSVSIDNWVSACEGDTVQIGFTSSMSGKSLQWSTGDTGNVISVSTPGDYVVLIDSSGCSIEDTVHFTYLDNPTPDIGSDTAFCDDKNIAFTVTTEQSYVKYNWGGDAFGSNSEFYVDAPGLYKVEVLDSNGCKGSSQINVSQVASTPLEFGKSDTTICPSQTLVLKVPAEIQGLEGEWTWGNGSKIDSTIYSNIQMDTVVHLSFENEHGCFSNDSLFVKVSNQLPVRLKSDTACVGESVVFKAPNLGEGFSYQWNGDPGMNTNILNYANVELSDYGSVRLEMRSPLGCSGDTSVQLIIYDLPQPTLYNDSICEGESIVLNPGTNGDHIWSTGSVLAELEIVNVTDDDSKTYSVEVTNENGCVNSASMDLFVQESPDIEIFEPLAVCEGQTVDLFTRTSLNLPVYWSTNDTTDVLRVNDSGTYKGTVWVGDCSSSDSVEVDFMIEPEVVLPLDSVICEGTEWYITPLNSIDVEGLDFEWSTSETTKGIVVESPGIYWMEVSNGACSGRDSLFVGQSSTPVNPFPSDTTICFDDIEVLSLDVGRGLDVLWNDGDTVQIKNVFETGFYEAELENEYGCKANYSIEIYSDCPSAIWLPNAFTPNDDGINDKFTIMGRGVESVSLEVYNRWGELIWKGNDIGDQWDGTYMSSRVQQDVYVYKLNYEYINALGFTIQKERYGTITLFVD